MNTKRQTVWLVSMLSLMVVLSAYYLFTQDMESPEVLTDGTQTEQGAQNATEASAEGDGLVVNEVEQPGGEGTAISEAEQKILDQVEEQGLASGGIFSELLAKREMENAEAENRIMAAISQTQSKEEEAVAAAAELEQLEDKNARITNLESELMKSYEMALVAEEGDRLKVVVTSEKLEKKQAADIIKLVMSTMEVDANQVSVQYVP
ncbi:SpoIIIAH-like family protein [Paenibacillus arenilitoris]|uniref:SpoIIIAH-like family protein n=1 Tax=Paenibacillus arenilitoris TaxID=2772299 RepID=A0A927H7F9_9BACL|nr:SpoIIIAH-like family protein [Paenibacillus arenilitoris]MBD2869554.1 SpoIIIAH-like family protein [Paenibacillus arenilitoris]